MRRQRTCLLVTAERRRIIDVVTGVDEHSDSNRYVRAYDEVEIDGKRRPKTRGRQDVTHQHVEVWIPGMNHHEIGHGMVKPLRLFEGPTD